MNHCFTAHIFLLVKFRLHQQSSRSVLLDFFFFSSQVKKIKLIWTRPPHHIFDHTLQAGRFVISHESPTTRLVRKTWDRWYACVESEIPTRERIVPEEMRLTWLHILPSFFFFFFNMQMIRCFECTLMLFLHIWPRSEHEWTGYALSAFSLSLSRLYCIVYRNEVALIIVEVQRRSNVSS